MWSLCFTCLVVFVVALENVAAQDYTEFYRRLASLNRPVIISARSGIRRYYESPKRDASPRGTPENAPKLQIDVYYETDCPDSMRFITRHLYPLYQEMGDVLDVNLYPYGKANKYYDEEKKKYIFYCHHGPSECRGNTIQACALQLYPNHTDAFHLINCMESYPKPSQSCAKCARRHSLDWEKINKCATGELGYKLLLDMAEKTENLNPRLYFVPWIVFDKVFNEEDFKKANRDLKSVVCRRYKGRHASCANQA